MFFQVGSVLAHMDISYQVSTMSYKIEFSNIPVQQFIEHKEEVKKK